MASSEYIKAGGFVVVRFVLTDSKLGDQVLKSERVGFCFVFPK